MAQTSRRIVILRASVKKTRKTPPSEIRLAKQRTKSPVGQ
ncbi:type II toxin-antitoxin system RelE/ParE family toxin [Methylobacterium sp. J-077]|nr:type II toxin-antitoxin system RelE/ParE family toxin [Methylobacterium sp. J-077]